MTRTAIRFAVQADSEHDSQDSKSPAGPFDAPFHAHGADPSDPESAQLRCSDRYAVEMLPARLVRKIRIVDGCWIWVGARGPAGYGNSWHPAKYRWMSSHRLVYELLVGAIPSGLQLDHLCRNRACCNPAHLEPVTPRTNTQRGALALATCKAGLHPKVRIGRCRSCFNAYMRRWKRARRGAGSGIRTRTLFRGPELEAGVAASYTIPAGTGG